MLFVWVCLSFWDSNVCLSCFLKDSNLAFWILASLIEDQHLSFRLGLRHWKKKNPPNICWTSIVSRSGFQFFLPLSWVETYLFEQKNRKLRWDKFFWFCVHQEDRRPFIYMRGFRATYTQYCIKHGLEPVQSRDEIIRPLGKQRIKKKRWLSRCVSKIKVLF